MPNKAGGSAAGRQPSSQIESATAIAFDRDASVCDIFFRVASSCPDRIAIVGDGDPMTYGDLAYKARGIGQILISHGVRKGDFVGLIARRSTDTVALMIAILSAGAVFVPLDPAYPREQLKFMAADCSPRIIVASEELATIASDITPLGIAIVTLKTIVAGSKFVTGAGRAVCGDDPAYAMYTSGSTGRPKGVLVRHRAINRLVLDQTYAAFGPNETILHLAPLAFDASTFEIWGALLNGSRLAILSDDRPSLDRIGEVIAEHAVTTAWLTAGVFHLMVDRRLEALHPLRQLLAGGDVLSPDHVRRAMEGLPNCRIINGYGPTENTTFSCCYHIAAEGWGAGPVPIGDAIKHSTAHIVDDGLRPVAAGEIGQLCVGGDGVAIGYLNLVEETSQRFRADPFSADHSAMLYLTGDLARRRTDGAIEFLGRADRQVKINGRRIEPGEIEHVLRADPSVEDAVVVDVEGPAGKYLVAFVKPLAPSVNEDARRLRLVESLKLALPAFMVPARVIAVPMFALNTVGKVDQGALRSLAVEGAGVFASRAPVRPSDARGLHQTIRRIWQQVLKREEVGSGENFFDLGGNSLQLLDVHSQLLNALGRDIPVVMLFEFPKIDALAAALEPANSLPATVIGNVAARHAAGRAAAIAAARERRR